MCNYGMNFGASHENIGWKVSSTQSSTQSSISSLILCSPSPIEEKPKITNHSISSQVYWVVICSNLASPTLPPPQVASVSSLFCLASALLFLEGVSFRLPILPLSTISFALLLHRLLHHLHHLLRSQLTPLPLTLFQPAPPNSSLPS